MSGQNSNRVVRAALLPLLAFGAFACADTATIASSDGTAPGVARTNPNGLQEGQLRIEQQDASGIVTRSEVADMAKDLPRFRASTKSDSANLIALGAFLAGGNTKPGRAQILPLRFGEKAVTLYAVERSGNGRMKRFGLTEPTGRTQYVVDFGTGHQDGRVRVYTDGQLESTVRISEVAPVLGANEVSDCFSSFMAAVAAFAGGFAGLSSGNPVGQYAGLAAILYGVSEWNSFWASDCGTSFFDWIGNVWDTVSGWFCDNILWWCEE